MPMATIGQNCNLGQNVFVAEGVKMGNNVKVQNNVSLYSGVLCGDDVFIGPSVVFTNVKNPRSTIARKNEYLQTIVEKGVTIGANATIVCGITIGSFAFIGAGAVITKDVPPYALLTGNPGKQTGWKSEFGDTLVFDEEGHATCSGTGEVYILKEGLVSKV